MPVRVGGVKQVMNMPGGCDGWGRAEVLQHAKQARVALPYFPNGVVASMDSMN